jgi:4-diphosphocytidyl-2-C-methyl-D-erythritol kinase
MSEQGAARSGSLTVGAPAKINLFLHVHGKRDDGYHYLESLVVFAETGDRLSLSQADDLSLSINGPFAAGLAADENNLVLKAAHALHETAPAASILGATIALEKNLPVASGIGGGSADAAATLRGLNVLWNLQRSEAELCAVAAGVGSDVPACVLSRSVWMRGRGEVLEPVEGGLPPAAMVLVNAGVAVPTEKVFGDLGTFAQRETAALLLPHFTLSDLVAYLRKTGNDLAKPAIAAEPAIADTIHALKTQDGCMYAQMSGSGATCFGLFEDEEASSAAAAAITKRHPAWWVAMTRIAQSDAGIPHI